MGWQPTPRELWLQARGNMARYHHLMRDHGYEPGPDVPDTWPRW